MRVAGRGRRLIDIAHIEHGLGGEQIERLEGGALLVGNLRHARRLAFAQEHKRALDQLERLLRFLVLAAHLALERRDALLQAVEIGEHQLGLDGLGVGDRIDAALDMDDVVILEAAEHIGDGVDLADHGEELIAEAFALRCAAHEPGDVDEGEPGRDDLGGLGNFGERVEARVGHRHLADIRLDGAEGIVGGGRAAVSVSALKRVDLPTLGSPTMPHLNPMSGNHHERRTSGEACRRGPRQRQACRSRCLAHPCACVARLWPLIGGLGFHMHGVSDEGLKSCRWRLSASSGAALAMAPSSGSSHSRSDLTKFCSTQFFTSSLQPGWPMPMRTRT